MRRANTLRELQARTVTTLDRLDGQVASGALPPQAFLTQAQEVLDFANARAAILGAYRARPGVGNVDAAIRAASSVGARTALEQRQFLLGFAVDLANGVYRPKRDGGKGATQRQARFALYALRLGGTASRGWLEAMRTKQGADAELRWVLGPRDKHCSDCQREAGKGWRPAYDFSFLPGEGRTRCLVKCGCRVETRDGQASYDLGAA